MTTGPECKDYVI